VAGGQNLPFSIDFDRRPYNTLALPCECVIRPHRSSTYVDAVYCYGPSSVVCRSVCYTSEPCKNGFSDQGTVCWVEDSGGPKEPCIRWGSRSSMERGNFEGKRGVPL